MAETHKLRTSEILPKTQTYTNWNKEAEARAKACSPAPLPSLDHLKLSDYDHVYEPSDDTYLMLDALGYDFDNDSCDSNDNDDNQGNNIISSDGVMTTLEIGCGTGVNTIYLANLFRKKRQKQCNKNTESDTKVQVSDIHIVTDINQHAIEITKQTARHNNIPINTTITNNNDNDDTNTTFQTLLCDIATPLLQTHARKMDVIIFNPPYVPTPNDEVGSNGIEASWAGGTDGRLVIDRALPQIASLLSYPHGAVYMITVDDNKPEEIANIMMEKYGIRVIPYLRRRARNEFLTVLKMTFCV